MYRDLYQSEKRPNYCTKCKKSLITTTLSSGYDAYSGQENYKNFLACPDAVKSLLDTYHDVWELKDDIEIPAFRQQYIKTL